MQTCISSPGVISGSHRSGSSRTSAALGCLYSSPWFHTSNFCCRHTKGQNGINKYSRTKKSQIFPRMPNDPTDAVSMEEPDALTHDETPSVWFLNSSYLVFFVVVVLCMIVGPVCRNRPLEECLRNAPVVKMWQKSSGFYREKKQLFPLPVVF